VCNETSTAVIIACNWQLLGVLLSRPNSDVQRKEVPLTIDCDWLLLGTERRTMFALHIQICNEMQTVLSLIVAWYFLYRREKEKQYPIALRCATKLESCRSHVPHGRRLEYNQVKAMLFDLQTCNETSHILVKRNH
jgi:hypothetical protein